MQGLVENRRFLFLQGPHGPFFSGLGAGLRAAGAQVFRVGFNRSDQFFWRGTGYIPFAQQLEAWPKVFANLIETHGITDVVCYGPSRPIHQVARTIAGERGLTFHVFEEGYLRPYWVTYERGGANASSPCMSLSLDQMTTALEQGAPPITEAPDRWGDMNQHMFWGATYHAVLLLGNAAYPGYRPHRRPGVGGEFRLYFRKLTQTPIRAIARSLASARIRMGGFPYHLVLLQLAHDANFRSNGPFPDQAAFLDVVFRGFAAGAPKHHHLVLKAHPLEDGREPLAPLIRRLTDTYKLQKRVHYVSGGKLARLLDAAKTAITVNSTSAEQALWRGLPLRAFGDAVYKRPEFVSDQEISEFFRAPRVPDRQAYLIYRAYLLATSQIPGGFYAYRNRRKLLRQLPDLLLSSKSPNELMQSNPSQDAASKQHLRSVF